MLLLLTSTYGEMYINELLYHEQMYVILYAFSIYIFCSVILFLG
jgi:hypothetical protein